MALGGVGGRSTSADVAVESAWGGEVGAQSICQLARDTLYLRAQSQGHHTIDCRVEERGVERRSARRSSLKGRERAIVSQTNIGAETVEFTLMGFSR